jgi:hypothetical protein
MVAPHSHDQGQHVHPDNPPIPNHSDDTDAQISGQCIILAITQLAHQALSLSGFTQVCAVALEQTGLDRRLLALISPVITYEQRAPPRF